MKRSSSANQILTRATLEQLFDEKLAPIQKELKNHGKQLRVLRKDQKAMLAFLDKQDVEQKKRLDRVEDKLGIPRASYI